MLKHFPLFVNINIARSAKIISHRITEKRRLFSDRIYMIKACKALTLKPGGSYLLAKKNPDDI